MRRKIIKINFSVRFLTYLKQASLGANRVKVFVKALIASDDADKSQYPDNRSDKPAKLVHFAFMYPFSRIHISFYTFINFFSLFH